MASTVNCSVSSAPNNILSITLEAALQSALFSPSSKSYKLAHASRLAVQRDRLELLGCKIFNVEARISAVSLSVFYLSAADYRTALGEDAPPLSVLAGIPITGAPISQESPATVIISNGSGSVAEDEIFTLGALFLDRGFNILSYNYSGHGQSTGEPSERGCYANIHDVYNYALHTLHIPKKKLFACGNSLGGAVTLALLDKDPEIPLILDRTFSTMLDIFASFVSKEVGTLTKWLFAESTIYNSLDKIAKATGEILIVSGAKDSLVPKICGEKLKAAAGDHATLLPLSGEHSTALGATWETEEADQDAFSAALEEMTLDRSAK